MDLSAVAAQTLRSAELPDAVAARTLRKVLDLQTQESAELVQLIDQAGPAGRSLNLLA